MLTVYVLRDGRTETFDQVDPAWLQPDSPTIFWVDVTDPTPDTGALMRDVFNLHELAIEDALASVHHPKVEAYPGFLYVILHGIDFEASQHQFATRDVDFFLGPNYLMTVHADGSRSVDQVAQACARNAHVLAEGPAALMHRLIDVMVDNYRPEVDKLENRLDEVERAVFNSAHRSLMLRILELKRDVISLRRVVQPERDVVGRLARREFSQIGEAIAYRFRDVHDHLVRLTDESMVFHDRLTSLLDAHLSYVSNRLNEVMKVLTIITTLFGLFTMFSGLYGMNVKLPHFPGGDDAQFWWILGLPIVISVLMVVAFKKSRWL